MQAKELDVLKDHFTHTNDLIAGAERILALQKKKPEHAEYFHHKFILDMPPIEEAVNFSLGLKIAQLHYFMQYVHDDAHRNFRFKNVTTEVGTQQYIDEAAYSYEIMAIKHLKKLIRPPIQLFDFLDATADYLAKGFDDPQMTEILAAFPFQSIDDKLDWSEALGQMIFEYAQNILQLPVKKAITIHQDNPDKPFVMASFASGKDEQGDKVTVIKATSHCLSQNMFDYLFSMCHEHIHSLFDQMADIYVENSADLKDHPYLDSFLYAWSISHTKGLNRLLPSVYGQDMEEIFCNGTAGRFVRQITRYSPSYQITHQPLLEI